jgi:large subunit ribosomal protein L30
MPSPKKPGAARPKKTPAAKAAAPAKRAAPKRRPAPAAARATAREATKAAGSPTAAVPESAAAGTQPAGARPAGGRTIVIEQYGSGIGCQFRQKLTLRALGLRRPRQRVVRPDNPAVRGMVEAIPHLVRIVEDGHAS